MKPALGLVAAIQSEYISPEQWISWADEQVMSLDPCPMWIMEMALARECESAMLALREFLMDRDFTKNIDEMILGLIYLLYSERRITFQDFLLRAGDHTDPSGSSHDCEYFYTILNDLESSRDSRGFEDSKISQVEQDISHALDLADAGIAQITPITEQDVAGNSDHSQGSLTESPGLIRWPRK